MTTLDEIVRGAVPKRRTDKLKPLRDHAMQNIRNNRIFYDAEGNPATVRSGSVNHPGLNGGRITLIPMQWDGEILSPDEAAERAINSGIRWPVFGTHEEATRASKALSNSLRVK